MNTNGLDAMFGLELVILPALFYGCLGNAIDIGNSAFDRKEEYRENFQMSKDVHGQIELSLQNTNGSVTVLGSSGVNEVRISGKKIVQDLSLEEAKQHIEDIRIEIVETASALNIRTIQPNSSGGRTYRVDYEIQLPNTWRVTVGNVNGQVDIRTIKNQVKINVSNGQVEVSELEGDFYADVTNGGISARGMLPEKGTCDLSTMNGAIELAIPRTTSATVSASTTNGSVSVSNLLLQLEMSSRTRVIGKLGDGKGTIKLSAVNGAITLKGE